MLPMFIVTLLTIFLLFISSPTIRKSITAEDDNYDSHDHSVALVAARNPVRESGPPACMAKLIMLRHKMQNNTRRRKSPTIARQPNRAFMAPPQRNKGPLSWMRFARLSGKQHH